MVALTARAAALSCCALSTSCAHLDVQLSSFMSPDHGISSARLPPGYTVENRILRRGTQTIGITYAHHPRSRMVILYSGGDAFHRSLEGAVPLQALALGADVALFDYPGYGDTSGTPTTASVLDTIVAAYDHLFSLDSTKGKARVLYGFSLGGMVVAQLAQDRHADAVVLEATAATVGTWAHSRVPLLMRPFVRVRVERQISTLDSAAALDHFPGRILVITSRADEMVPAAESIRLVRRLLATRRDVRVYEFPGRRHGSIMSDAAFGSRLGDFLERVRATP